ncbi:MAG: diguanylate cyclase [Cycloclasticus sp. symbiont of Bathymodiolus heckerae]|nr:MAG: diguanylate cyclase [Cycloclasticus sp. symbiont of Bathymodiolus heckerae]
MDEETYNLGAKQGKTDHYFSDDIRHYQQLFELNPSPMLVCDEKGLLEFNTATLKMFNAPSRDAFFGLHLSSLAPDFQPNGVSSKQLFNELILEANSEGTASIECLCKRLTGDEIFPVEVVMSLLSFPDKVIHQVTLVDLSGHQHWQNALEIKKEVVELTLKSVDSGIVTTSPDGLITYMNEAACELSGWSLADAINQQASKILNVVAGEYGLPIDICHCLSNTPVERVRKFPSDAVLITKDGSRKSVHGTLAAQYPLHTKNVGCVITIIGDEERAALSDEMQWHATHDALTRLPNRVLLADRFKQAMFLASRHNNILAVCMMDLDEFKPVNDTYGHAVGDELLVEVASRIKKYLRQEDTVARLGGDEFVILIGDVSNKPELFQALQRLKVAVSEPYVIDGQQINISCSIGVALYPEEDVDSDTLLRHADQAMFVAKQSGRNRIHWFDVEEDQQASSSQKVIARIEQALLSDELELYYQPKVNMRTGTIVGMEALLRWQHPEKGLVFPLEFLPVIEQHDLIISIGDWVMESALKQLTYWQEQGKDWSVSVNIAAKHFHLPSFYTRLKRMLNNYPDVSPCKLEIEILESVALGDIQHVQTVIGDCQDLGVRFALDDFGTGYSSLSYLKRLPADTLKIDQSFIRDILDDKGDLALVQAITSLAVTFERDVVAEGVETIEHGGLLMRLGCDVAQGYGIARPMPSGKVIAWSKQFVAAPMWTIWAASEWDLKVFPLLVAQHDIREWVDNVIAKIEDATLPVLGATLSDESKCRFGNWYKSDGLKRYGELDIFKRIDPVHRSLHTVGDEIIQLYIDNKTPESQEKCKELHLVKDELLGMLDQLHLEVFSH